MGYRNQKGIVLLEILVSISLFFVVATAMYMLYYLAANSFQQQSAYCDSQYVARTAVQMILKDIREAEYWELQDGGEKLKLISHDGQLSYYIEDSQLYRHGKSKTPVAESINKLYFELDDSLLEIDLEANVRGHAFKLCTSSCCRLED